MISQKKSKFFSIILGSMLLCMCSQYTFATESPHSLATENLEIRNLFDELRGDLERLTVIPETEEVDVAVSAILEEQPQVLPSLDLESTHKIDHFVSYLANLTEFSEEHIREICIHEDGYKLVLNADTNQEHNASAIGKFHHKDLVKAWPIIWDKLKEFSWLRSLVVNAFEIYQLSDEFYLLPELRALSITNQLIEKLPSSIFELKDLKRLTLHHNKITSLYPTHLKMRFTVIENYLYIDLK